uniref:Uncharacterized protein n=1 Tax=Aquisalinus luteolus TaxID=1566827 RepID=A0A8J3A7B4_9PROT|nr:hypothetical protein GCM10011355_16490 [Aquisalinus luteolus]
MRPQAREYLEGPAKTPGEACKDKHCENEIDDPEHVFVSPDGRNSELTGFKMENMTFSR